MKGGFLMKKIVIVFGIIVAIFMINQVKAEEVMIPNEAIRLRVIPNSNQPEDQALKEEVRDNLQKEIYELLKNTKSIEEARALIKENIHDFEIIIEDTIEESHKLETFQLNYGMNYFPKKVYKGVTYEDGYYESLVITLGKGEGDNWWCVLFPPLCLLEADEVQEQEEVEYKFFVKEILDKFFKNDSN